jgi:hypothetical protein
MNPSLFTLVRFTISETTLHALLSGDPERRRALRAITWGSRTTDAGEVLVTAPLRAEQARTLRAIFSGAEGVAEIDATPEYSFGSTRAPADYDGFGTLTLGTEGDERLVAIRREHLAWQTSRYASGLHGFQPLQGSGAATECPAPTALRPGVVVHFQGGTRRFVIATAERCGDAERYELVALSGALRGCHPTAVEPSAIEIDADQTVTFTGAAAATLRRKYEGATRVTRLAS